MNDEAQSEQWQAVKRCGLGKAIRQRSSRRIVKKCRIFRGTALGVGCGKHSSPGGGEDFDANIPGVRPVFDNPVSYFRFDVVRRRIHVKPAVPDDFYALNQ